MNKIALMTILAAANIFLHTDPCSPQTEALQIAKAIFAQENYTDINDFITGEYDGHPNLNELPPNSRTKFLLPGQRDSTADVNISITDSSGYTLCAQNITLREILWNRAGDCKAIFDEIEYSDYEIIDDSKNGYLKISGTYPTCGCYCNTTIGAYRSDEEGYVIVQTEEFSCHWEKLISSNKTLEHILPSGFGINYFNLQTTNVDIVSPVFYIDMEVPRKGTDTKLKLELIPFGIKPAGKEPICYSYDESDLYSYSNKMYAINKLVVVLEHTNTIDLILSGNFNDIVPENSKIIEDYMGDDLEQFKSIQEIQTVLIALKNIYDLYNQLDYNELVLGWDPKQSRFFIKERKNTITIKSFEEFIINAKYWTPLC